MITQLIVDTEVKLFICFIDWQKAFDSLSGPDRYRSQKKLVLTGETESRVAICIWDGRLKYDIQGVTVIV